MTIVNSDSLFTWRFWLFGYAPYRREKFLCLHDGVFFPLCMGLFINLKFVKYGFKLADGTISTDYKIGDKLIGNGSGKVYRIDALTPLGCPINYSHGLLNWCAMRGVK